MLQSLLQDYAQLLQCGDIAAEQDDAVGLEAAIFG